MKPEEKQAYLEEYADEKRRGVPFFPDAVSKDMVASAAVIVALVVIAAVFGSPLEEPAQPNDAGYTPRPEWYFLFLFQFLKYVPGRLEAIGVVGVPLLLVVLLFALPLLDRSAARGARHRPRVIWTTFLLLAGITTLTVVALVDTPPAASVEALEPGEVMAFGEEVYASNCSVCHGQFGEGGPDPIRTDDVIAPISSSQYLTTHDDETLRSIVSQGQPSLGMAPFALSYGGPLRESEIDAVVTFVRSWEADPPVVLPESVAAAPTATTGVEIFGAVCTQCHGADGSGGIGPSLSAAAFHEAISDGELFDAINLGHPATSMIGWGDVLTASQIQALVDYIRELGGVTDEPVEPVAAPSFGADVLPIFEAACTVCHGAAGGWDGTTWQSAIESGANGPAVVPGDPDGSLLVQKLLGTTSFGTEMPPGSRLSDADIALIVEWVRGGAVR